MNFKEMLDFLRDLERNNSKLWMDENRKRYKRVRDAYILWLDLLDRKLMDVDPHYCPTPGKKAVNRINNNLMFHPNKPIYKDHFGAALDKAPNTGDFYIQIGVHENMLAGGFWRPDPQILRSIREAVDYDGEELKAILEKKSFKETFGGLEVDEQLKMAPKGFSKEHPHLDLLKNKTFAVKYSLTEKGILHNGFIDEVISIYLEMLPFRRYLNNAVTV